MTVATAPAFTAEKVQAAGEHLTYAMSINTQDVADASRGA
jgi:hypothetical protein